MSTTTPRRTCPDDGACHHGCTGGCFRVHHCAPLSGAYVKNCWPADVKALTPPYAYDETAPDAAEHAVTAAIVEG